MTDKTAIEKAKEAETCMDDAISCILRGIPVRDLAERMVALDSALAALEAEKPAEDALNLVYQWRLDYKRDPELESMSELSSRIQSFAEAYHAKRCRTTVST